MRKAPVSEGIIIIEETDDSDALEVLSSLISEPIPALQRAADSIRRRLRLKDSPISITQKGIRASGFAGIIRISPRIHLEIVPKIFNAEDPWREDLIFMTGLSRYGSFLPNSSTGMKFGREKYPTVLAEMLARAVSDAKAVPLRIYRNETFKSFDLIGDAEPIEVDFPDPEGIEQNISSFTDCNEFMGTIGLAAEHLRYYARNPRSRIILSYFAQKYRNFGVSPNRTVPAHSANWRAAFEIARRTLFGGGVSIDVGSHISDMIVRGSYLWEDVLWKGLKDFEGAKRKPAGLYFGDRIPRSKPADQMQINPDYIISAGNASVVIDAKYKPIKEGPSASDIYEIYAFSQVVGAQTALLLYPSRQDVGTSELVSTLVRDQLSIEAYQVGVRGISQRAGLRQFSSEIKRICSVAYHL